MPASFVPRLDSKMLFSYTQHDACSLWRSSVHLRRPRLRSGYLVVPSERELQGMNGSCDVRSERHCTQQGSLRCDVSRIWLTVKRKWLNAREGNEYEVVWKKDKIDVNYTYHNKNIRRLDIVTSGPGSSVGIPTGYGLDCPGIESRWGRDVSHLSRQAPGPTQPPVQWVPGLSWGWKATWVWPRPKNRVDYTSNLDEGLRGL
jgi:hypothetical protein